VSKGKEDEPKKKRKLEGESSDKGEGSEKGEDNDKGEDSDKGVSGDDQWFKGMKAIVFVMTEPGRYSVMLIMCMTPC